MIIYLDATLITVHSEKEHTAPTFERGFGFHPLWAFADHLDPEEPINRSHNKLSPEWITNALATRARDPFLGASG